MSWDLATNVLYTESPTAEQIDSLSGFVKAHADELKRCYAPEFRDQRPTVCKFVSQLFIILESSEVPSAEAGKRLSRAVEQIADLLTREEFFKGVFHYALKEGDLSLLELVYSSLFTEIVFNSSLTSLWFKERLDMERSNVKTSEEAQALNILISVQVLDIRQNWAAVKPKSELLLSLQKHIEANKDRVTKLVWTLALYFMAQQHYTNETDDEGIDVEPLMRELQMTAGVHWSQVLKDQLQVNLRGLDALVFSLETVRERVPLQFVSGQLFSQTVADVVSCLLSVSKPTEPLCAALATAVEPHPALQRVPWISTEQMALVKSKCPSSLGSLVSIAQVLDMGSRIDYLGEMRSYVCTVDAACLDLSEKFLEDPVLGTDVRTVKTVSILPARVTDNQGILELAPDTRGTLLACDGNDCLVMWYFTYNGWSLLGRIFENANIKEGDEWRPMTVELLKLISMTVDANVLTMMSAGLARGDVVDLLASRLQSWVHSGRIQHCKLIFTFLAQFALIDPPRIWALVSKTMWTADAVVLDGLWRLLSALWPSFDSDSSLHIEVMNSIVELCGSQYFLDGKISVLPMFQLFLPHSAKLRDDLLSPSPLRDVAAAPLLANLNDIRALQFCRFCVLLSKKSHRRYESAGEFLGVLSPPPTRNNSPEILEHSGTPQSYLEKQLFSKAGEIASLFTSGDKAVQKSILELWTALISGADAPPLLAFLEKGQRAKLKDDLMSIATSKLEAGSMIASLARFLVSADRQESLLDLLREPILPLLETRLKFLVEASSKVAVMEALTLVKGPLKSDTIAYITSLVEGGIENVADPDTLLLKRAAIELLTKQFQISPASLKGFVSKIDEFNPKLVTLHGTRPSLHSRLFKNLKTKWPEVASEGDTTATFELNLQNLDAKLDQEAMWWKSYRPEVLEALNNRRLIQNQTSVVYAWCQLLLAVVESDASAVSPQSLSKWVSQLLQANSMALPVSLQQVENDRTATALSLLQIPKCQKPVSTLEAVYHQITDLTLNPNVSLQVLRPRLRDLMNMSIILLSSLPDKSVDQGPRLASMLVGILDVAVIKQMQIFGVCEDTLPLHLLILNHSLRILRSLGRQPLVLVQSMIESGSDFIIVNAYATTPIDGPRRGELILTYIQEWLRSGIMTDSFVRNGLMNALIDAPLSRLIQAGGIAAHTHPEMHSLWIRGVLPTVALLLKELEDRVSEEVRLFIENYASQINFCLEQWKGGQVNSALIDESWLLCVICRAVRKTHQSRKGTPRYDEEELLKLIDVLLSHQHYLSARASALADVDALNTELRNFRDWLN